MYDHTEGKIMVKAFTGAGWGSSIDDRRSVSGIMVMLGGAIVVHKSRYQRTVTLSTAEAECMALSLCTQEVRWVRSMLKDLGNEQVGAAEVWKNNQGAITLTSSVGYNARTKHIDVLHHFIRENVANGTVSVKYITTEGQDADVVTKATGTKRLKFVCEASGVKIASKSQNRWVGVLTRYNVSMCCMDACLSDTLLVIGATNFRGNIR